MMMIMITRWALRARHRTPTCPGGRGRRSRWSGPSTGTTWGNISSVNRRFMSNRTQTSYNAISNRIPALLALMSKQTPLPRLTSVVVSLSRVWFDIIILAYIIKKKWYENWGQPLGLDWEVMRRHSITDEGHHCYDAIRDKGFQNFSEEEQRICRKLAKVI